MVCQLVLSITYTKGSAIISDLKKIHNDGQTDASNGEYKPPNNLIDDFCSGVFGTREEFTKGREENESYNEGHAHTESQKNSGSCFLTTACVEHAGLADDCRELTILRSFRDNYVARQTHGPAVLAEYYKTAPALVRKIEQSADRDAVLSGIFATVTKAVTLIEQGDCAKAFTCYETMFVGLKSRHSK